MLSVRELGPLPDSDLDLEGPLVLWRSCGSSRMLLSALEPLPLLMRLWREPLEAADRGDD